MSVGDDGPFLCSTIAIVVSLMVDPQSSWAIYWRSSSCPWSDCWWLLNGNSWGCWGKSHGACYRKLSPISPQVQFFSVRYWNIFVTYHTDTCTVRFFHVLVAFSSVGILFEDKIRQQKCMVLPVIQRTSSYAGPVKQFIRLGFVDSTTRISHDGPDNRNARLFLSSSSGYYPARR